jgi:hypothetical protein
MARGQLSRQASARSIRVMDPPSSSDAWIEQDLPITVRQFAGQVTEPMARELFQERGGLKRGDDSELLSLFQRFSDLQDAGARRSSLSQVLADIQCHYRFQHGVPKVSGNRDVVFDPDQVRLCSPMNVLIEGGAANRCRESQLPGFAPTIEGGGMDAELRSDPGQIVAARIQQLTGGFKLLLSA